MQEIFITGGTGYIGRRLIKALLKEGNFHVKALIRKQSAHKLPSGCEAVTGNALDASTYQHEVPERCIFIHLVGVPHPSPRKKKHSGPSTGCLTAKPSSLLPWLMCSILSI